MTLRKHAIAMGLALAVGISAPGFVLGQGMGQGMDQGQGSTMGGQGGMGPGMMMGGGQGGMGPGMMMGGGQGGMGPGMMMGGGQGGMGPGMMMGGGQGGMGPGMMGGGMMPCPMMGGGQGGMGPGMMGGGMMTMLDAEQRSEMRELMQEHRPAQFERMGRVMNLRDDLMAAMQAERPDPDDVQALHAQMAEIQGEMMAEMVRMRNAMHDLMTDEQREQWQQAEPETIDPDDHDAHH
ncbi:Spy/CpxP family protein refolding chaperone [Halomonas alkalisoli]|uniref:Spy/CpxP family protein refolding chaperone n=1 Tax=Halomonas alkalisoli TaxID=2907158 RepID=UPI001F22A6F7|nr:Spy/CpxP family protein refolding chaperone [Halomonas alkalisoli]MCE9683435.1 Spy/CpxP family protein refolding chaperone [Halomonas alkalisoli]